MAKVGIITKFLLFSKEFDQFWKYFPDDEIKVYFGDPDADTLDLLEAAEKDGCDALVTGAFTYEEIFHRTYLPIVDVEADFQDIICAWANVKQRGGTPKKVAVFLVQSNPVLKYAELAEELSIIFDAEVRIIQFASRNEYEPLIASLKGEVDLIIAGEKSVEVCRKYGIPNEFLRIGFTNKFSGVQNALSIARAQEEDRTRNKRLQEILNFSKEGLIVVDKNGEIRDFNRTANKILSIKHNAVRQHKNIWDMLLLDKEKYPNQSIPRFQNEIFELENGRKVMISSKILEVGRNIEGAFFTVRETKEIEEIEKKIRKEVIPKENTAKYSLNSIVGNSKEVTECKNLVKRFGRFEGNVMILGETGTGKELFAQSIHNESKRKEEPFFAVNCAALPTSILESELFGYSEGSFTGAVKGGKPGIFELAHGGTLYLDEITEMDISCQSKLLRVIQEKEVRRIGDSKIIPFDVRVIAASYRDIWQEVVEKRFREDLYYRLNVMNIHIPPLRERTSDIMELIGYFMEHYGEKYGTLADMRFTRRAEEYLRDYPWHGNVRELQNFVERLYVYGYNGDIVDASVVAKLIHDFKQEDGQKKENFAAVLHENPTGMKVGTCANVRNLEKEAIQEALELAGGNRTKAAEMLGMSRTTLWRRLAAEEQK